MRNSRKQTIRWIILGFFLLIVIYFLVSIVYPYRLQEVRILRIYDVSGRVLSDVQQEGRKRQYMSLAEVPDFVISGLLLREDRRFWQHKGVDIYAIARSLLTNMRMGRVVQGASTIDQQVIKISEGAYYSRGWKQKLYESLKALSINIYYTKEDILLYYINNLDFGSQVRGFATACQVFFRMDCAMLTDIEQVYLIALTKYPGRSDIVPYAYAYAQVLGRDDITMEDLRLVHQYRFYPSSTVAPFFVAYVHGRLRRHIYTGIPHPNGIVYDPMSHVVRTAFDKAVFEKIEGIFRVLQPYFHTQQTFDACVIVMRGDMLVSMNVMRPYGNRGTFVNGCVRKRQVGSAIKPFIYALALHQGLIQPGSIIKDTPVSYVLDNGGVYTPQNFSMNFQGDVSIEEALASSLNVPAVKVLEMVGLQDMYAFFRAIGTVVKTDESWRDDVSMYGFSLALGSKEISPLDFTRMWTIFQQRQKNQIGEEGRLMMDVYVGSLSYVREILSINRYRLANFPQYNWFDIPGAYSKSGTSRGFVDGWVCGGYRDITVCVRVGNYNGKSTRTSGYQTAGPLWHAVIQMLMRNTM